MRGCNRLGQDSYIRILDKAAERILSDPRPLSGEDRTPIMSSIETIPSDTTSARMPPRGAICFFLLRTDQKIAEVAVLAP